MPMVSNSLLHKTVCMHFWRLRKHHLDPELFLYGMPIPVVQEVKFLASSIANRLFYRTFAISKINPPKL